MWFTLSFAKEGEPVVGNPRANISLGRSLLFDQEDLQGRDASLYQLPIAPPLYPPVYGPPLETPQSEGFVDIFFPFDDITVECIVGYPLEHVIWTRFPCPNQIYYGDGIQVADGSKVFNPSLYNVRIDGQYGEYISTLTINNPIDPDTSGLYRCEAYPHAQVHDNGYPVYGPPQPYPVYTPVQSEVFIIGGNSLLENCYGNLPSYPYGNGGNLPGYPYSTNKVGQSSTANKKPSKEDKVSKIKENRRNMTKSSVDRKDTNAKYLRYNLKFDNPSRDVKNSTLSNLTSHLKFPPQPRKIKLDRPIGTQFVRNTTSSLRFDVTKNGGNRTWQAEYKGNNALNSKRKNVTVL